MEEEEEEGVEERGGGWRSLRRMLMILYDTIEVQ
jgi:hypothetical protein